jgi:hypothetical protein
MLLGADFLRVHRALIAYSQRKVYFTYTGGTVFPTRQGKPCGETALDERTGNANGRSGSILLKNSMFDSRFCNR